MGLLKNIIVGGLINYAKTGSIAGSNSLRQKGELDGYSYEPDGGEDLYPELDLACDEDEDYIECEICGHYIRYDGYKNYLCPYCGKHISRREFFNAIGAELYLDRCLRCDGNYPYCREDCEEIENF